jgi:hypothetical protein
MNPAMAKQADLFEDSKGARDRRTQELVRAMGEAADALTLKEVAFFLGLSPATVANTLSCRDRKAPPLSYVMALVDLDPEHRLLRWLADQAGCELKPREKLTPEQELAALKRALKAQGQVGHVIAHQAWVEI